MRQNRFGLSVAFSRPFTEDRAIDLPRLVAHARRSLADETDVRKRGAAIDAIRGRRAAWHGLIFGPRASRPLMWSVDLQVRIMGAHAHAGLSGPGGPRSEEHEQARRPRSRT
jgi:hypothetical protein